MNEEKNKRKSWRENLKDKYRLVLLNDESFEEIRSYNLTPLNVYIIVSSILLLTSTLLVLLIIFTPIKNLIPGYGEAGNKRELTKINKQINGLQKKISLYEVQNQALKRKLMGKFRPEDNDAETDTAKVVTNDGTVVERIEEDELLRKEVALNDKLRSQKDKNGGISLAQLKDLFFFVPVDGDINASFSLSKHHLGTDIIAPKNTPIKSVLDGTVIFSDFSNDGGYTIIIQHDFNLVSVYKHNASLLKKAGEHVKGGEAIAIIGNSGEVTTGPHLHFELWHNNKPVDSENFILYK